MADRSNVMYPGLPRAAIPSPIRGKPDFVTTIFKPFRDVTEQGVRRVEMSPTKEFFLLRWILTSSLYEIVFAVAHSTSLSVLGRCCSHHPAA